MQLHTKKKNYLKYKKLNNFVYVVYNQRLKERYNKRKRNISKIDPIILRDVGENE